MKPTDLDWTRRDFIKGTGCVAMGVALGLNPAFGQESESLVKSRVVLVRDKDAVAANGRTNVDVMGRMMDQAITALLDDTDPVACWKKLIQPNDTVGIKSNEWGPLPTPPELEEVLKARVISAGVPEERVGINDRGVLSDPVFQKATALVNVRPLRTHAWSGVGSLIKNPIMFSPEPPAYHDDSCADLGALWSLPLIKGKVRLNVLVMLTPLFHGKGRHHFDPTYIWTYGGLLVGIDPVAVDTIGLKIFQEKRLDYFGEERPLTPPAHHIAIADKKFGLGNSELSRIELVKLGWEEGGLI